MGCLHGQNICDLSKTISNNVYNRAETLCLKRNSIGHLNLTKDYVKLQMCCKLFGHRKMLLFFFTENYNRCINFFKLFITAHKRSLGQCNIFTGVCHSFCFCS